MVISLWALAGLYVAVGLATVVVAYAIDYFFADGAVMDNSYIQGHVFFEDFWMMLAIGPLAAPLCAGALLVVIAQAIKFAHKSHWKAPWTLRKEYKAEQDMKNRASQSSRPRNNPLKNEMTPMSDEYTLAVGDDWPRHSKGL